MDLVFAHSDGSPLDPGTVSHTSKKIVKKSGLESILHDNRHTFATLMMSFGVNPKVVDEMLVANSPDGRLIANPTERDSEIYRNYFEVINEKSAQDALERRLKCIEAEARRRSDRPRYSFSLSC